MSARQAITLVAWREINERLHCRVFLVSTVLLLALVGASSALSLALTAETTCKVASTFSSCSPTTSSSSGTTSTPRQPQPPTPRYVHSGTTCHQPPS